jgi:hypothetical protein
MSTYMDGEKVIIVSSFWLYPVDVEVDVKEEGERER